MERAGFRLPTKCREEWRGLIAAAEMGRAGAAPHFDAVGPDPSAVVGYIRGVDGGLENLLPAREKRVVLAGDLQIGNGLVPDTDFARAAAHHGVGDQLSVDPEAGVEGSAVYEADGARVG